MVENVRAEANDDKVTAKALSMYGQVLVGLGEPENALLQYEESLSLNPNDFSVLCFKTDALLYLGRLDDVIAVADRAIKMAPEFYQTYQNKMLALRMMGKYEDALECAAQLLKITSSNHFVWVDQGATYMLMRQFEDAERCFLKSAELCETSPGLSGLATLYTKLKRFEAAQKAATRALEISTKRNAWQARVAIWRSGIHDPAHLEALRALPEATPEDCKKKSAPQQLVHVLLLLSRTMPLTPFLDPVWSLRKVSLLSEALSLAEETHKRYPTQISVSLLMAKLLFANARITDARQVLETLVFTVAPQSRAALKLSKKISSINAK